jgi:hypothetical protein
VRKSDPRLLVKGQKPPLWTPGRIVREHPKHFQRERERVKPSLSPSSTPMKKVNLIINQIIIAAIAGAV